ncbi:MAG TPA: amino acid permease [Bacteroidia bacterium]|jgi:amino acid transporter|nr:amino acid permease [Bacteroidia bacterium]
MATTEQPQLERKLGLFQSTVINMIDMVGIGPFVVLSIVIQLMGGPWFLYAWLAGALLSIIDAMIWSELGAAFPLAGGSFNFLRASYGEKSWGKLFSFLYVWQTMLQAPLVVASGAIGFAHYFGFLVPLNDVTSRIVSGTIVIVLTLLLYRKIETIGKISILLWSGVIFTMLWIIYGGISNGHFTEPLRHINDGFTLNAAFAAALGAASVKTIYSYLGYYNVCHLGGEIKNPSRNIPLSMILSVLGIAALYISMNMSVVSVIPWQEAAKSEFVVSTYFETLYGHNAAIIATILILWVAFASLFAVMLGYSRVPYAAAKEGEFFEVFAKVHPTRHFPHIALLGLGITAFVFSLLFKLSQVITAILAMRIVIQFIGQAIGLIILRKKNKTVMPFKMPLYPLPIILAILIWGFIFISTGKEFILSGGIVIISGTIVYLIKSKKSLQWPFNQ